MTETLEFGALGGGRALDFDVVVQDGEAARRHPIRGVLSVGKSDENDVVVDRPGVSRFHLELQPLADGVGVRDLGSKNGTFYNGARITEVKVGAGAHLRMGGPTGVELSIELSDRPAVAPSASTRFGPLVGQSTAMRSVFAILERTAPTQATILLVGETGTGKDLAARAIHEASPRASGPFVVVDCGAIPRHLIESELFGHVRGAFTDASQDRTGAFEAATGGTLFLDEVGELPLDLQPKLLRALESRTIQRLGETARRPIDVRVIAATHRDLAADVAAGRYRQDLFFRLAVVNVAMPPLRERGDDVIALARHLLGELGAKDAFAIEGPIAEAMLGYTWPGNVRELRNALERSIFLGAEHGIPMAGRGDPRPPEIDGDVDKPFKEAKERLVVAFERAYVANLMERYGDNISAAARAAGIDRNYLYRLLKKHGLERS